MFSHMVCPPGSAVGGHILQGLPMNVVYMAEVMNRRAWLAVAVPCRVSEDKHGGQYCSEETIYDANDNAEKGRIHQLVSEVAGPHELHKCYVEFPHDDVKLKALVIGAAFLMMTTIVQYLE
ncbi:hypothetical protein SK128_021095 [Halocaridina rubra]|uniref:Uncharacterized protein n=1 Tax=Halocaridina rubra TaxID=373956 RepID=A0AAN9AH78_HALRR